MSKAKTKICLLITQSEFGGAQKYVYYLATSLPKARYDVTVACGTDGLLIPKLQEAGIDVIQVPSLLREINPIQDFLALLHLFRVLREKRPHIVHANSTKAGFLGRLAARLAGVPIALFTAHGFFLYEPFWRAEERFMYVFIEWLGAKLSDCIIAVCEADRQKMLQHNIASPDNIFVVHNGLEFSHLAPARNSRRLEQDSKEEGKLVGTVANFYPIKGLRYFIEGAALVKQVMPEVRFAIVGDGEQRVELRNLARQLDLDPEILFLGHRDNVPELLSFFNVFVLSSVAEGLPFALLEAMAAARPVVATTVGGVPELILDGQTGLLVPSKDPQALAEAVISLLKNPSRAEAMGVAARQRVLSHFTVDRMIAETEQIYRRLLAKKLNQPASFGNELMADE